MSDVGRTLTIAAGTSLGDRIRIARVVAGRSMEEMASVLGVSARTYQRIETGERPVRRIELVAIAEVTGQEFDLFGGASLDNAEEATVTRKRGRVKA